ncbi:HEAT repeat domain-containing protein [candidate division KSB1 bacterium]|nr:HEAT repeat domain-containing protein [candidate division KSB1 bacterium]
MGFYDKSKIERDKIINDMAHDIARDIEENSDQALQKYAASPDTYIRKHCYLIIGKLYQEKPTLRDTILLRLFNLSKNENERIRQTCTYALGEIGKTTAEPALKALEAALDDPHHSVRNAVIGALKQLGQKNPAPVLQFAQKLLHHPDAEIRRQIVHGIELRGRTHPEEVLPLLAELQFDENRRVAETIVHVLGQISYKKNCLEKVVAHLKTWQNAELVEKALNEILETHTLYGRFSAKSYREAREYIKRAFS